MKISKTLFIIIVLFFGLMSCKESETKKTTADQPEATTEQEIVSVINSEAFEKQIGAVGDVQLIDVRTSDEVAEGSIPGAVNFDFYASDFKEMLKVLNKEEPVYVFCRSGRRSNDTAGILKEMGFARIYDLEGGIMAWMESGKEVVK